MSEPGLLVPHSSLLSRDCQVSELEVEFEKLPGTKAQQTRFLRSQQDLKAKFEAQAAAKASGDGEGMGKTTWLVIGSEVWPKFCCIVCVACTCV